MRTTLSRRLFIGAAAGATLAIGLAGAGQAQEIDQLHFIAPGGVGGGWDGIARGTGEALTKSGLIGNASFENMSGGGGGKAIAYMIETAGQRKTTLMANSTPIIMRSLRGTFPQSFRDLTPIAAVQGDFGAFAVAADSPFQSFADVAAAYAADPRSVKVAGGSVRGGMDHLVVALAFQAAGADPNTVGYVPYDAGGEALAGLLSGETQLLSSGLGEMLEQQRAGQVRIVGITASERVGDAPDVPTLKEQGFDVEFVNWRGFFGPPGLADDVADSYAAVLEEMHKTDAWEAVRARNAWINIYRGRADFVAFLEEQEVAMKGLFDKLGIETVR